jgi:hypothetical protein
MVFKGAMVMKIEGDAKVISAAFIKARGEMGATVATDAKGNYGKYATLAALVEATSATFANHGLAIVQEAAIDEAGVVVETWLLHESGAMMQFAPLTMPLAKRDAQGVGSAITYARRYQLSAVCGLAPDDDDGQAATDAQQAAQRKPQHRRVDAETGEITNDEGDAAFSRDGQGQTPPANRKLLSPDQLKRLNIVGRELYGDDDWEEQRPKLVEAVSKGAVTSSKELTPNEADTLIKGIEKKIAQIAKAQAKTTTVAEMNQQVVAH